MRHSVVQAVSARRGAASVLANILFLISLFSSAPALAGDRALIDFIGYSQDFRYFAFEEFGIQDGSGFAYSSVYVVDLTTDSWVVGTPIRVGAESQQESLAKVRTEVAAQAIAPLEEFGITVPVEYAAMIGDGTPGTDARTLTFGAPGYLPGVVSGNSTLELSTFTAKAASPCAEWFGSDPKGYELRITDSGGARRVHRDTNLPRSRGCPTDYRIFGVVMPFGGTTISNAVAIISVYPGGFEGPDRRFLAVPLGL